MPFELRGLIVLVDDSITLGIVIGLICRLVVCTLSLMVVFRVDGLFDIPWIGVGVGTWVFGLTVWVLGFVCICL